MKVYCSLVRSVVEYASVVFSNLPQYLVDALEKLQKRALKIIYPNYSYEAALDAANLEKLECRIVNICSSFVRVTRCIILYLADSSPGLSGTT